MRCKFLIMLHVFEFSCAHYLHVFPARVCWLFRDCVPCYTRVKSRNTWRVQLRGWQGASHHARPPNEVLDGRWPQHAKQAAPQWNAAHGSTTLVVHGTRRCCDPPVRPMCSRRMRHTGLHGSSTRDAQYEQHCLGPTAALPWYAQATGTAWARSVRQCGRERRPTASVTMRAPRRGVARSHLAAVLASMMRTRTSVARVRGAHRSGAAGAPGCRWQPHGGVIHVTVVQSPNRWGSLRQHPFVCSVCRSSHLRRA